jgi:sugar/nucleoside kinase (ribokinase family)
MGRFRSVGTTRRAAWAGGDREPAMMRRTIVFGPAYLDRVMRVDRPLLEEGTGPPIDQSVEGRLEAGEGLSLIDPVGRTIEVGLPLDWPGPEGTVFLDRPFGTGRVTPGVQCDSWHDDLGGMGAGFAAALGGALWSALGAIDDPVSQAVAARLEHERIEHRPIRLEGLSADWTLLVSSGAFGDKLPIGFRGCHAAVASLESGLHDVCDLRVVASLPNRLAAEALGAPGARVRMFAPAVRNVVDREMLIGAFAHAIDLLSLNQREWELMLDREAVAQAVPIVAITDGPRGSVVRFRGLDGSPSELRVAAFPRSRPPRDTNRAGETYAASLVSRLLEGGWTPGPVDLALIQEAAERASAAAALVLDRDRFGFPTSAEVDQALRAGRVGDDEMGQVG